jgi:hypothetical protein
MKTKRKEHFSAAATAAPKRGRPVKSYTVEDAV